MNVSVVQASRSRWSGHQNSFSSSSDVFERGNGLLVARLFDPHANSVRREQLGAALATHQLLCNGQMQRRSDAEAGNMGTLATNDRLLSRPRPPHAPLFAAIN
jgi:hypothetical protein